MKGVRQIEYHTMQKTKIARREMSVGMKRSQAMGNKSDSCSQRNGLLNSEQG